MKFIKIAAGLMAVSMMAAVTSQVAFAADSVVLEAEKVTATQGEDFTLTVNLNGVPASGVSAAEFAVTYDASVITIKDVAVGSIVNTDSDGFDEVSVFKTDFSQAGKITVTYGTIGGNFVTTDGDFLTITGTASGADGSSTDVSIIPMGRPLYDGATDMIDDIYVGSISSDGSVSGYDVTAKAGSVTIGEGGEKPLKKGDANEDGNVDIADVVLMNRVYVGVDKVTEQGLANADIDGSGKIELADSMNVLRYLVHLIDEL
ncbi:MAG: hypothetical protein K2H29_08920 [Oscillospiraceae bacterium]|nr:hypothetical protein [Oscillospiraceae bacterium]MDE5885178.1 hypothetical protein [Oscillospiraceae bacterium]